MKLRINKLSKIISLLSFSIMIIFFIMFIISKNNTNVANFMVFSVISKINSILFYLLQYFPPNIQSLLLFLSPLVILLCYLLYVVSKSIDLDEEKKIHLSSIFFSLFSITLSSFIINISMGYTIPYTSSIDTFYLSDYRDKEYDLKYFEEYVKYIYEKIDKLSTQVPRDVDGEVIINDIDKLAINNLKNLKDKYYFLDGVYPNHFQSVNYNLVDEGTGFTSSYSHSISILKDLNNIAYLNNLTHELCHLKGIDKESDAVFCTYEAGIYSDNYVSKYAAYFEIFYRLYSLLKLSESEYFYDYDTLVSSKCITNHYTEFCSFNYKEVKEIKYDATRIYLETFNTKETDYYNNINNVLSILNNNYDIEVYDKYYSRVEFNEDIHDKTYIIINSNNEDILDIIKPNKNLFINIKQLKKDSNPLKKTSDLNINYYLKPFNKENYMTKDYKKEYSYSRSIRLFLEKYNYIKDNE